MISIYPGPERDYTVLVRCFTFNQSKYIEDALNGFVMQQTTFPFVCLVVDDASTDGGPEVIKSWMERECDMADAKHLDIPTADIIIVPHKTNENCTMAVYFLKENLFRQREKKMEHVTPWREHCRYEALCEGDDYWIDPLKLQKQVNFLDTHLDYSMCWTDAYQETNNKRQAYNRYECDCQSPLVDIIEQGGAFIPTCSIVIRNMVIESMPSILKSFFVGDYPLQMWCGYVGKCYYFKKQTCVYRYLSQGSWTLQNFYKCPKEAYLKYFYEEKKIYDTFNRFFDYKYSQSFEKCSANFLFSLLVWSESYELLKPYIHLRRKYKMHVGKAIILHAYGFTFIAKIVEFCSVIKGHLTKQIKSI